MGNLTKIDSNKLYQGDSFKIMDSLEPSSIDMIFADPPYNLSNDGFTCKGGKAVNVNKGKWDKSNGFEKDLEFHVEWIKKCKKLLKPNGTIWISGTYHSIYSCGYALNLNSYHVLNDICWFKPNASPNLSCRFFTASHETLIWARKEKKGKHTFNYDDMKNGHFPKDVIKKPGKQMRSVWAIGYPTPSEKALGKHPTQKPIELLDRIIRASTNEGDVILDPFMGSGTTGVVATKLNRNFIGIELEKEYIELATLRIKDALSKNKQDMFKGEVDWGKQTPFHNPEA